MSSWRDKTQKVINWHKRLVYDFDQKKMVKYNPYLSGKDPEMPMIGFMCTGCDIYGPYDHWLIDGKNLCTQCAEKHYNPERKL